MQVLFYASSWWNPIIQVENPKKLDPFCKKSRFSFWGVLITSKMACIEPWTQEHNFLKLYCESGLMDVSMKCKSILLLASGEIPSFKLKIQRKIKMQFPKNQDSAFYGCLLPPKLASIEPWTQEFNFLKFPFVSGFMDFSMKCKSFPVLAYNEIQSFKLKILKNQDFLSKKSRFSF